MRKTVFIALLFLATLSVQAQSVDDILRERVEAGETPGIVVGVYRDGKATYYAYGYSDVAAQRKPDSKTLFEIGSITKTFTTTVIAQMAQEGKIKLSDPIQSKLPKEEVVIPTYGDKVITFEDLAAVHSGLPRMPDNFNPPDVTDPYLFYTEEKMFAFLTGYKLTRDIGSQYEYSNLGMGLLGVVASKIDGKPYREVVESRILKPLKMRSTYLNTPGRQDKNSAIGYSDGKPVHAWTWNDASSMQGAGGLLSNAEDMMKYLLANLNPPDNSLGRAMEDAHKIRKELGANNMKVGLGWHIRNKTIWHNGGTGGFRTFAGFEPEKKMAVVVLTNSTTGADDIGFHLMDDAIALKKIRKPVTVSAEKLKTYVGTYEVSPTFKLTITEENGQLSVQATGQPKYNLFAESETKFYLKVVDAQVEFSANDQGAIDKLTLYQNGAARTGMKKP